MAAAQPPAPRQARQFDGETMLNTATVFTSYSMPTQTSSTAYPSTSSASDVFGSSYQYVTFTSSTYNGGTAYQVGVYDENGDLFSKHWVMDDRLITPSSSLPPSSQYSYSSNSYTSEVSRPDDADNSEAAQRWAEGSHGEMPGYAKIVMGVAIAIFVLAGAFTCMFCYRRGKLRRTQAGYRPDDDRPEMRSRPHRPLASSSRGDLTRDELFDIIPVPAPTHAPASSRMPPPLPPRNAPQPRPTSTAESRWTDDSEIDALATDGSTIARTISTRSSTNSRLSIATENPFDHPAYTLLSARTRHTQGGSSGTPTGTWQTWQSEKADPFADGMSPLLATSRSGFGTAVSSPISPVSPAAISPISPFIDTNVPRGYPGPPPTVSPTEPTERSWSAADDDVILRSPASSLRRGPTIVRHTDGGQHPHSRSYLDDGEGARREYHIPPPYSDLYPATPRK